MPDPRRRSAAPTRWQRDKSRAVSSAHRTAVVTDTTAYLPDELAAEHDIHRISLYVTLDGVEQRESDIDSASYGDFFERLSRSDEGATTSQPSVGDFVSLYEPLLADGRDIVSIHISSGISGTYQSALQARQQLVESGAGGERIQVWDSRTGCGGQGMMCLVAARAAEAGASGEDALAAVERARETLKMWFAIDTLEYLRKGGRIGARASVARIRAADQADPHAGGGDQPGRAGADPPTGV